MSDFNRRQKKTAVIFDLDGTLANLNGRSPYHDGQAQCRDDLLHEHVAEIARMYERHSPHDVLIVSGRFEDYREQTEAWLDDHGILHQGLYMRPSGNTQPDTVIKLDIYREKIEPRYDIVLVFDDRPKVIRMWRDVGLNVADVGKGIEF